MRSRCLPAGEPAAPNRRWKPHPQERQGSEILKRRRQPLETFGRDERALFAQIAPGEPVYNCTRSAPRNFIIMETIGLEWDTGAYIYSSFAATLTIAF